MNKAAKIVWYDEYEQEHEIYTDDPQGWTNRLREEKLMFACFPGDMPIPRNKKGS